MPNKRSHKKEELDNLKLQGSQLENALTGLSKINRWFGNSKQTLKEVQDHCNKNDVKTIVDLACGGGDNLIAIAQWCKSQNQSLTLIGIDGNQNSLDYASTKSNSDIKFIRADILTKDFEIPECDLLISSHFVYHFSDAEFIVFLKKAHKKVKKAIILSELQRSHMARILFFPLGLFFGKIVLSDGLKAIERSFTKKELQALIKASGFVRYSIVIKPFFRLLAVIETN